MLKLVHLIVFEVIEVIVLCVTSHKRKSIDKNEISLGESATITIGNSKYAYNYKFHIIDPNRTETVIDNNCTYKYCFNPTQAGEYIIYAEVTNPLSSDIGSSTEKFVKLNVISDLGDINNDGVVNVMDATELQKHIAGTTTLDDEALLRADVDSDDSINIKDATLIQKYSASLITEF